MHLRRERGSILLAITIAVVGFVLLAWLVADACFEDESEVRNDGDDLGQPALVLNRGTPTETAQRWNSHGRDSDGKCQDAKACDDRDFSPTLDQSPVIICVQPGACQFGEGEAAALLPPNPARLIETIQKGAEGIGAAAGALAGAVAAFPPALLL